MPHELHRRPILGAEPPFRDRVNGFAVESAHRPIAIGAGPRTRQVALLIESSGAHGRGLLRGISRYHAERGKWSLHIEPGGLDARPPCWLRNWSGDGILAHIDNRRMADAIVASGLPAVDLRFAIGNLQIPVVDACNQSVAEHVARHFLEREMAHFAYCGYAPGRNISSDLRGRFFARALSREGRGCRFFRPKSAKRRRYPTWEEELERMTAWVRRLPKPVGVMAVNDHRGLQVLEACRRAGVVVPEELALVGVDNDEILCDMATPSMSSVALDVERLGYVAAGLLDRMMHGETPAKSQHHLSPLGVVARRSSDVTAVADREVAQAARWIQQHACENISVDQVVRQTSLSRRCLEKRFAKLLGRTLNSEIVRVKLERAQQLLIGTDLSLSTIAHQAGICSGSYLNVLFHRKLGRTPADFRKRHRGF